MKIDPTIVNDTILAVDIGKNGAFCYNWGKYLVIEKLTKTPREIVLQLPHRTDMVVAEEVHIFGPQRGGESLLEQKGVIAGIAACHDWPCEFIRPKAWIDSYTIKTKKNFKNEDAWKDHLLDIARSLGHELADYSDKLTRQVADSLLIWNYYAAIKVGKPLPNRGQLTFA